MSLSAASGVIDAAASCGALHIGSGVTTIESAGLEADELLSRLTAGEECDEDDWEDWTEDSTLDWYLARLTGDGFRVGRWRVTIGEGTTRILTDGTRLIALSWPDSDTLEPPTWEPMFEWSFSNESGGPCIWNGACTAGLVAPDVLMEVEHGDQDPGIRLTVFDAQSLRGVLAAVAEYWAFPLLVASSGLPGLTQSERDAVWGARVDNSQKFSLTCSHELRNEVVQKLLEMVPGLQEAQDALFEPSSARGKSVYAWLRGLAGSQRIHERADWFMVFSALKGEIVEPTPLSEAELEAELARSREAAKPLRKHAA